MVLAKTRRSSRDWLEGMRGLVDLWVFLLLSLLSLLLLLLLVVVVVAVVVGSQRLPFHLQLRF